MALSGKRKKTCNTLSTTVRRREERIRPVTRKRSFAGGTAGEDLQRKGIGVERHCFFTTTERGC